MKKILIVDDESSLRFLFREVFADEKKFEIKEAATAAEAARIFPKFLPDMVVLDVALPDRDGRTLLDVWKGDPHMPKCRLVLMSGVAEAEEATLTSSIKVDLFLAKPFNIQDATNKVLKLLD